MLKSSRLRESLLERSTLIGGGSPDEALNDLREVFEQTLGVALKEHVVEPRGFSSPRATHRLDVHAHRSADQPVLEGHGPR